MNTATLTFRDRVYRWMKEQGIRTWTELAEDRLGVKLPTLLKYFQSERLEYNTRRRFIEAGFPEEDLPPDNDAARQEVQEAG